MLNLCPYLNAKEPVSLFIKEVKPSLKQTVEAYRVEGFEPATS
jgi:hypothetical protein